MVLSCSSILQKVNTGEIDLNPIWQRDVVWTAAKQSAIIDSFFRHYYVPPVLYSERHTPEGEVCFICIDGKQRISSICNFMNNVIPVREAGTNKQYWYEEDRVAGKYPAIDRKLKTRFDSLQIHGFLYMDLADQEERDMFARVQMGSVLTPAEKLAAKVGPWSEWWRQLVKKYFDNPQLNVQHVITMARGKDWLFAAQITLFIWNWGTHNYHPSAIAVSKHLDAYEQSGPDMAFKAQVEDVFAKFVALCNHETYALPLLPVKARGRAAKPLAPVEFVFSAVMVWKFPDASLADLSYLVERMKQDVRKDFKDVMMNTRVTAFLRLWIDSADVPGRKRRAPAQDVDDDDFSLCKQRQTFVQIH
ncbi:Domain of unknown function DUF262 [Ceraceosorus bombacis]|uniref:GmrSD restriction endonucleases N-terminal domain-containing protein n=1 Tax=Ceraceosorus bombacis TaxID=401625 RepID=A0A0P1BMQ3_9BASI|nr:Domain of unknown function DUF262 [Ceraceosorus bombacis]